jgi:hypothetical protein
MYLKKSQLTYIAFREHPAQEVYVTGTFDDWSKSEKLEKVGDIFVKDVTLSSADEKIYYKVRTWKGHLLSSDVTFIEIH